MCGYFFEDISVRRMHRMIRERTIGGCTPNRENVWVPFTCTWSWTEGRSRVYALYVYARSIRYLRSSRVHTYNASYYVTPRIGVNDPDVCSKRTNDFPTSACTSAKNHENSAYGCVSCAVSFDRYRDRGSYLFRSFLFIFLHGLTYFCIMYII